jgi:Flp pilus assembly protein CpaB
VDPSGAEVLAHAGHEGEISLVLRNPEDTDQVLIPAFSTRQMLGRAGPAPKSRASVSAVSTPRPGVPVVRREPVKIRIIRDASVTETPAVPDSSSS